MPRGRGPRKVNREKRRRVQRNVKRRADERRARIREEARSGGSGGGGADVRTGGSSTARESGIIATQNKDKKKSLEQSIGSLDRRIQNALKAGNLDLVKDLRSRQNKFVKDLGYLNAHKAMISNAPLSKRDEIRTRIRNNPNLLNKKGLSVFNETIDRDFLDPTRKLINENPEAYGAMYPIANQLRQGLPGTRFLKGIAGIDDKKQQYTDDRMPGERYALDKDFGAGEGATGPESIVPDSGFDKSQDRAPDAVPLDTFDKALDVAPPGVPFQTMTEEIQSSFPTLMNPQTYDESSRDLDKNVAGGANYKTVNPNTFVPYTAPFVDPQKANPVFMDATSKSFAEQLEEFNRENAMREKEPPQMTTVSGEDFQMQQKDTAQRAIENIIADPSIPPEAKQNTIDYINSIQTFQGPSMIDMIQSDAGQAPVSNPTAVINQLNAANPASEAAALEVLNSLNNQNRGFSLADIFDANPDEAGFQLFNFSPNR
tara:strand:+ start:23 stop:1480 length:1458 start_codon:yes stop_codon:yes gene_type:complete